MVEGAMPRPPWKAPAGHSAGFGARRCGRACTLMSSRTNKTTWLIEPAYFPPYLACPCLPARQEARVGYLMLLSSWQGSRQNRVQSISIPKVPNIDNQSRNCSKNRRKPGVEGAMPKLPWKAPAGHSIGFGVRQCGWACTSTSLSTHKTTRLIKPACFLPYLARSCLPLRPDARVGYLLLQSSWRGSRRNRVQSISIPEVPRSAEHQQSVR